MIVFHGFVYWGDMGLLDPDKAYVPYEESLDYVIKALQAHPFDFKRHIPPYIRLAAMGEDVSAIKKKKIPQDNLEDLRILQNSFVLSIKEIEGITCSGVSFIQRDGHPVFFYKGARIVTLIGLDDMAPTVDNGFIVPTLADHNGMAILGSHPRCSLREFMKNPALPEAPPETRRGAGSPHIGRATAKPIFW